MGRPIEITAEIKDAVIGFAESDPQIIHTRKKSFFIHDKFLKHFSSHGHVLTK